MNQGSYCRKNKYMINKLNSKKIYWGIYAAAAAFAGYCIMLYFSNIYPFGTDTILRVDLGIQYSDFLLFFKNSSLPEKLYSFSKGLGGNTLGLMAYYTLSPFNILLYFFADYNIETAVFFIIGLKFSFMAVSAYRYFSSRWESNVANASFGFMYAMFPYFARYYFNLIWMDVFAVLPLLILGTERIIQGKGKKIFIIFYTWALVSNYYITYMASIFILVYFFFCAFADYESGFRDTVKRIIDMAYSVMVSAMISAPVLIPAYCQLAKGKLTERVAFERSNPIFPLDVSFVSIFEGTYMYEHIPQLLFTIGCVLLIFVFCLSREIKLKYKVAAISFLGLMVYSLYNPLLYYIFHGFSWPEGFPYRHIFIYAFLLLQICRAGFEKLNFKNGIISLVPFGAVIFAGNWFYKNYDYLPWSSHSLKQTYIVAGVCAVLIFSMAVLKDRAKNMLCLALAAFTLFNSCWYMKGEKDLHASVHGVKPAGEYMESYIATSEALEAIQDDAFYRTEDVSARPYNQPMALGYYGINHFSSTYDADAQHLMEHFDSPAMMYTTFYEGNNILQDSLLGIKYVLARPSRKVHPDYEQVYAGEKNTYLNPYALPLLFTADTNQVSYSDNGQEHIANMFSAVAGVEVLTENGVDNAKLSHATEKVQQRAATVQKQNGNSIKCTATGKYLLSTIMYDESWHIRVNGKKVQQEKFMDYFISVPLEDGDNIIEMIYIPQGFTAGCMLMGCGIIIIASELIKKRIDKTIV